MPIREVLTPLRPSVTWSAPLLSLRGLSAARTTRLDAAKAPTAAADCPRKSRRDSWLDIIALLWKKSCLTVFMHEHSDVRTTIFMKTDDRQERSLPAVGS